MLVKPRNELLSSSSIFFHLGSTLQTKKPKPHLYTVEKIRNFTIAIKFRSDYDRFRAKVVLFLALPAENRLNCNLIHSL